VPAPSPTAYNFEDEPEPPRAPRRKRRARRPLSKGQQRALQCLRLLVLGAVGIGVASLAFAFLVKVVHPYKLGDEQARDIEKLQAELAREEARNDRLRKRVAYLYSNEGAEREARRAGFYRTGETVYFLDSAALSRVEKRAEEMGSKREW
jgi:hypothetical protein